MFNMHNEELNTELPAIAGTNQENQATQHQRHHLVIDASRVASDSSPAECRNDDCSTAETVDSRLSVQSASAATPPATTCYYLPMDPPPAYSPTQDEPMSVFSVNRFWSTTSDPSSFYRSPDVTRHASSPPSPPPSYRNASAFDADPPTFHCGHDDARQSGWPPLYPPPTYSSAVLEPSVPPADYLGLSIINVVICCRILGLVAIVKSVLVRLAIKEGDLEAAERNSVSARTWNTAAVITGAVIWTVVLVFYFMFTQ